MENLTGKLSLVFRKKANGKTYLAKQYYKLPLQIMPPHYQDTDGTAFVYLLNPSGGILHNDRLLTEITVEKDSKALVTTPASTKFYKMDAGYAKVVNRLSVEAGGVLEYIPEHNVPYAQSSTYQENYFYLDRTSSLIATDMVTAGRVSRGEIFDYDIYSSKTKVFVDDELIAYDNSTIEPGKMTLDQIGMLEGFLTNGTMYIYGQNLPKEIVTEINQMKREEGIYLGVSAVTADLMLVRFMGTNMIELQKTIHSVWDIARRNLLGKPGVKIRKY